MKLLFTKGARAGRVIDVPLHDARAALDAKIAERCNPEMRDTDIEIAFTARQREAAAAAPPEPAPVRLPRRVR